MTDILYTSPVESILIATEDNVNTVITDTISGTIVLTSNIPDTVIINTIPSPEIITEFAQGPQGIPGPAGDAALDYEAGQVLSGHRVVMVEDNKAYYADCTILSHGKLVLGITTGASVIGAQSRIQVSGELYEPSWSWTLGIPVWLSTNGLLSQVLPSSGFCLSVGFPTSSTKLIVRISEPIFLI